MPYDNDELIERLEKILYNAQRAPDTVQCDSALHGLARIIINHTPEIRRAFARFMPPPANTQAMEDMGAKIVTLTAEKNALAVEVETLKMAARNAKEDIRILKAQAARRPPPAPAPARPPPAASRGARRGATNFRELLGDLVNCARGKGGMTGTAVFEALNAFHQNFDGGYLTEDMIWGVPITGDPADVRHEDDPAPLSRPEVVAMQTALFGAGNNTIRPMEQFFITHVQRSIANYMNNDDVLRDVTVPDRMRLRQRYYEELKLREQNERYARFSRAFALLEKRTRRLAPHRDDSMPAPELLALAERWFGAADAAKAIAQLCGYDHSTTEQAVDHGQHDVRMLPQELRTTVQTMERLLDGIDLDDPEFETIVFGNVKSWNRTHQRGPMPMLSGQRLMILRYFAGVRQATEDDAMRDAKEVSNKGFRARITELRRDFIMPLIDTEKAGGTPAVYYITAWGRHVYSLRQRHDDDDQLFVAINRAAESWDTSVSACASRGTEMGK